MNYRNEAKFDMLVNKNCHEQQTKRDVTFHYGVPAPAYHYSCDEAITIRNLPIEASGGNLKHIAHVLD